MQELIQQLIIAVSLGATYALIALGYTMVYGVLRLINFAHGEVYMVGAVVGFHLADWVSDKRVPPWMGASVVDQSMPLWMKLAVVFGGAMLACAALGLIIESCAYRPLRSRPRLVVLITAIGVSLLLQNVVQHRHVFGPTPRSFPPLIERKAVVSFHVGSTAGPVTISNIDLLSLGMALLLMAGLTFIVLRTRTGLALRAVSHRTDTAALMGINTNRTISVTFVIGSALAAVAGVMDAIQYNVHPLMGVMPGLKAFIAAVLGGIGSIPGALAGAMILALAETLAKFLLPPGYTEYADGVAFLVLILILLFKPSGLFGRPMAEKVDVSMLDYQSSSHVARPRLPVWVINLGLTALVLGLWPLDWMLERNIDEYVLRVITLIGINIILAVSLNLINGITGQFSLGHAGFMAIGAYVAGSGIKYMHPGTAQAVLVTLPSLLVLGGIVAAGAGLVVGIPALRLRGDYLAIATLGFGEIIFVIINATEQVGPFQIGGASGLHGIPIHANFFWIYLWVVICVVAVWRLAYSTKGLAFRAVREDEVAAAAMGVDTTFHKVAAFVVGAFFAGVAGGLLATFDGNLDPGQFRFLKSIEIVVMVVLGGSGSITGAILAAIVLTWLPEQLREFKEWRMIIYSLLLIGMMLLRPGGLMGSRELWWARRRAGRT